MTEQLNANELFTQAMGQFVEQNYDHSIELLTQALALDGNHRLAYTSRGAAYLRQEKHKKALADFDSAIEADPDYAKAYHLRGLAKERLDDDDSAMRDLDRAIALDPEYGAAYFSRANLHTKLGNHDLAQEDVEMVTHLTNRNIEEFANEHNVWRSHHLKVEDMLESEMQR